MRPSRWWRHPLRTVFSIGLAVAAIGVFRALSGCGGSSSSGPAPTPGSSFPQPQVRMASNGVLSTSLHTQIASNTILNPVTGSNDVIEGPTYEGTIPGPTLVVHPGDDLKIKVINNFPANPSVTRQGAFPHAPYTTNLHTHGLIVSPEGDSDDVFAQFEPGTTNLVDVKISRTHHSGTFWYHPHDHGSVSFQLMGGTAGMLIIKGGPGSLDAVPGVKAAKDIVMVFQYIQVTSSGQVVYVNPTAAQMGSTTPQLADGIWSAYLTGVSYLTTNGVSNPTLHMHPGEVQRWRMLNAGEGGTVLVTLQDHPLNVIANDGVTIPEMLPVPAETPIAMGSGQRVDVLVQAGNPGTYLLQALSPGTTVASVTPQGVDPQLRPNHTSGDFNPPSFPVTLATIVVDGKPVNMKLPTGTLPASPGLPSIETMVNTTPNFVRHIDFDLCGMQGEMTPKPTQRLPTCGWYFNQYDAAYWGGLPFLSLNMFRNADDTGQVNPACVTQPTSPACLNEPLINFQQQGLFDPNTPLFNNMIAGNYEEWTVTNRSFSDHPFHIHQNPFLVTAVNGTPLPVPEWHDTILVPSAYPQPTKSNPVSITDPSVTFGTITFRTWYNPITVGKFVTHCHIVEHEDVGMMQRLDLLPAP